MNPPMKRSAIPAATRAIAALALLGALVASGCRTSSPQNSYVVREHHHAVESVLVDRRLGSDLKVLTPLSERRQGRLEVQLQLSNVIARELRIEWQIEWYDAAGLQVGQPTNWAPERLGGGQILTVRRTAPTEGATSLRFNVRKSDTIQ